MSLTPTLERTGLSGLCSKFQDSKDYIERPYLKNKNKTKHRLPPTKKERVEGQRDRTQKGKREEGYWQDYAGQYIVIKIIF